MNVRHKPASAPETFLTPEDVKTIFETSPVENLFLCPCSKCLWFSNCTVEKRRVNFRPDALMGAYATIFALLILENCAALIYEFQKREIILDRRLYDDQLEFLLPLLTSRYPTTRVTDAPTYVKDLRKRLLKTQFVLFARPFEVQDVERELDAQEALPIDEDKVPKGAGDSGEVFAFRILEEYKGAGFKALSVRLSALSISFAS